jgi:hypothetical protein
VTHALSFAPYSAIVAADVNHDGKMDLVFINQGSSVTTFVTELGNGSGGFSSGPVSTSAYYGIYNLSTGDFDGDGKADLFSGICGPGGCNLIVFYGDGTGRFGSPTSAGANQSNWTVADVDLDGKSDIISSTMGYINSKDQPYLSVWYGAANRTLLAKQIPTTQCTFGQPAVGDFNGDHIPDIIFPEHNCTTSQTSSAEIAFLAGKGSRTFGSEQTLFNSTYAQQPGGATAVMRGNHDTKPDYLFSQSATTSGGGQTYHLLMNQTSGKFAACTAPNSPTGFHVCSPASGSTVYSPVKFSIGASGQVPMRKVEVWVDGVKKSESLYGFSHYAFLDASIPLSSGTHNIAIFAAGWDNSLQLKKYSIIVH